MKWPVVSGYCVALMAVLTCVTGCRATPKPAPTPPPGFDARAEMPAAAALSTVSDTADVSVEQEKSADIIAAPAAPAALAAASAPAPARTDAEKTARVAAAEKRFYPHYAKRLALFLDDTPLRQPDGIVALGDSITEGFPTSAAFADGRVINRGISGDTIDGVRARMDVSVAELRPAAVYLLISINDITGKPGVSVSDMATSYALLLRELRAAAPDANIYVQSVLPLCRGFAKHNARATAMNEHLRLLAAAEGARYVDLHAAMRDENGELREPFTSDGIHLSLEGYWAWIEAVVPPEDLLAAARGLAPLWTKRLGPARAADKIDPMIEGALYGGDRAADELVVYTPASGRATTQTNQWGCEAVVVDGVVTAAGGNDSPIPANGFVVSGHGEGAQWVSSMLTKGRRAALEDGVVKVLDERPAPQTPFEMRRERLQAAMMRLAEVIAAPAPDEATLAMIENELLALQREARADAAANVLMPVSAEP